VLGVDTPMFETSVMENAGHACFWDEPAAYNQRLRKFVEAA
jgi:hypothetical protein